MKKIILIILYFLMIEVCLPQPIATDSMYLAQTPPTGITPKRFYLPVSPGSFTAERIAITNDGKEIYYTVIHGYYPTNGDTIKCFKYAGDKWTGPFNVFNSYLAPGLSPSGDTIYFQNNIVPYQTLFSVRNGSSWTNPQRIFYGVNSVHYYQVTNNWNRYVSSVSNPTVGASDWCKFNISGSDSTAVSLGVPVCTSDDNLDFFIARDESFLIIARSGLHISFRKNNGSWTNPKSLGPAINFGLGMWGPFVTRDNKYLFYTTGTNPNYSDCYIYWSRIDGLMDSLRHTNFVPYLKNQIPSQTDTVGNSFHYTFPDSTFVDDDGNNTLTYSATLIGGNPLPSWLSFNPATRNFTGTPTASGTIGIRLAATDSANVSVYCYFYITIVNRTSINKIEGNILKDYKLFQNFPNPFNPSTKIKFSIREKEFTILKIFDILGKEVSTLVNEVLSAGEYEVPFSINQFSDNYTSSGIYFYELKTEYYSEVKKMIVLK